MALCCSRVVGLSAWTALLCRVSKPTVRASLEERSGRTVGRLRIATFTGRTQASLGSDS